MPRKTTARKGDPPPVHMLHAEDIDWLDRMLAKADLPPYGTATAMLRVTRSHMGTNSSGPR